MAERIQGHLRDRPVDGVPEGSAGARRPGRAQERLGQCHARVRVDADHLEKTITIDDPKYYTRPWVALDKLPYRLQSASLEIPEQECVPSETTKYNQLFANPAAGVKP